MASRKIEYGTPVTGTGGLTSLATSSTFLAGYEWFIIDNTTDKNLDWLVQGFITVGTTPTVNTEIRLYLVGSYDGTTWPDVFDGTPSAETITSAGVRDGFAKLAASLAVDATTTGRAYPFFFPVAQFFGGNVPKKVAVFVTHNTVVALNATAGNHSYAAQPIYETVA
jgi:hypothetical protein